MLLLTGVGFTQHQPAATWAPDDALKYRPKHVQLIKVNKSK